MRTGEVSATRTGPVGRSVRLLLAALLGLFVYTLIDAGVADFRGTEVLGSPGFWIITGFATYWMVETFMRLLPLSPGQRVWGPLVLVAVVVVAGGVGLASTGSVWGAPLSDVVWWFDLVFLCYLAVTFALTVLLGTPGCENMVWADARARLRGDRDSPAGRPCVIGLHLLDNWEARRRARRQSR